MANVPLVFFIFRTAFLGTGIEMSTQLTVANRHETIEFLVMFEASDGNRERHFTPIDPGQFTSFFVPSKNYLTIKTSQGRILYNGPWEIKRPVVVTETLQVKIGTGDPAHPFDVDEKKNLYS